MSDNIGQYSNQLLYVVNCFVSTKYTIGASNIETNLENRKCQTQTKWILFLVHSSFIHSFIRIVVDGRDDEFCVFERKSTHIFFLIYIFCLPCCARSLSLSFSVALYKRNFENATLRTDIYILIILPVRSHQHCHLYQMTISIEIMQLRFLWKRATFFTIHSFSLKLVGWLLHRENEKKTEKNFTFLIILTFDTQRRGIFFFSFSFILFNSLSFTT